MNQVTAEGDSCHSQPFEELTTGRNSRSLSSRSDDFSEHTRLLMSAVAELTDGCILSMSDQELIFAIRMSRVSFLRPADVDRLPELNRKELERMAFKARYALRVRLTHR